MLNPAAFTPVGPLPSGPITLDTSGIPTVNGSLAGVVVAPPSGGPDVAVFTFSGGAVLALSDTILVIGSRPAALLFTGPATLHGNVVVESSAGAGGAPAAAGAGPGGGAGSAQGGGGGGYSGGGGTAGAAPGGAPYGVAVVLQGGSGGGGASGSGGRGGGALELGALGELRVTGSIVAAGTDGQDGAAGAGGGSGGHLIVHAFNVVLESGSLLAANGANGGSATNDFAGGGGGGGRVYVLHNLAGQLVLNGVIATAGGLAGGAGSGSGDGGQVLVEADPVVGEFPPAVPALASGLRGVLFLALLTAALRRPVRQVMAGNG